MAIVFLIGGTGNQLFQYAAAAPKDRFSTVFLKPAVRRVFKFTDHPTIFRFPRANLLLEMMAVLVLGLDLVASKLARRTLFTELDLRSAKYQPRLACLVRAGYFQTAPMVRDVAELTTSLPSPDPAFAARTCIHIRGGDLLHERDLENPVYGVLPVDYYREALARVAPDGGPVHVFTDDLDHARSICDEIDPSMQVTLDNGALHEMFINATHASVFVGSNSTLSYWILQLRGDQGGSVAPKPFQNRRDMPFGADVTRLPVCYT